MTEGEKLFESLSEAVEKPRQKEREANSWIRPGTWLLVDRRTSLRREGRLSQKEGRQLGRKIKAALKEDRRERARRVGEKVMLLLGEGELKEAWAAIWG